MSLQLLVVRRLVSAARAFPPLRPVLRTGGRMLRKLGWQPPALSGTPERKAYERWIRVNDALSDADRAAILEHIGRMGHHPLISVVMPTYETPAVQLRGAIASIRGQLYPHWELCIADDASPSPHVAEVLADAAREDPRIRWMRREANGHIAAASNSALALVRGEFVALMDHDDLLPEHALYEVAAELEAHPEADIIYTDEDKIDAAGRRYDPYFKPSWSIDLMLGHNLISHLGVYRRSLLEQIGGFREGLEGSQDYDLALRAAGATSPARIRHVPAVLYHWRQAPSGASFSQTQLDRCVDAAGRAITDHLRAMHVTDAEVLRAPLIPTWTRVRWPLPTPAPRVSIIVSTHGMPQLLDRCLDGLLRHTAYPDFEVLVVGNAGSGQSAPRLPASASADQRLRYLTVHAPNRSASSNFAVEQASGQVVVLLSSGIDVVHPDWLRELASIAIRPTVGAVGAKLTDDDGRIDHAGIVLGVGGHAGGRGVAAYFGQQASPGDPGYYGQYALARETMAVTGDCLALRREVYQRAGGLDAQNLPSAFSDIDLCLRIRELGLGVVWTPFAELRRSTSADGALGRSPKQIVHTEADADYLRGRWGSVLDADPFYHPAFDRADPSFRLADRPTRKKPWQQGRGSCKAAR